jgi:DNA-binding transcriptional regulator GbsR (MarR family)
MVEAMGQFSKDVGFVGATEGRLLGYLILADKPLTQDDLMALSGNSRGNVSTAVRTLIEGGFARKTTQRGSRREFYEASATLWRTTILFVITRIARQIDWVNEEFRQILDEARELKRAPAAAERQLAAHFIRRVETLSRYTSSAHKLLGTVTRLVERSKSGE